VVETTESGFDIAWMNLNLWDRIFWERSLPSGGGRFSSMELDVACCSKQCGYTRWHGVVITPIWRSLYSFQGKLDEDEKMYQRALQGMEKAWGPDQ
jgi:hypothetical protein